MNRYLKIDGWNIIEEDFHAKNQRASESIFSIGNGRIGQRGNFEETYTGDTLQGSYIAGLYFQDRTRVGWWKNGYPRYFSRMPNAPYWSGINLRLIDEELNLEEWDINKFERKLLMKEGIAERTVTVTSPKGHTLQIHVEHFYSMEHLNLCLIKYSVTSVNYEGKISLLPYINGDVIHESSNFNEKMWNIILAKTTHEYALLWTQTKREDSQACCATTYQLFKNNKEITSRPIRIEKEKFVGFSVGSDVKPGETLSLIKYTSVVSSLYCDRKELVDQSIAEAQNAKNTGWDSFLEEQRKDWSKLWNKMDVQIEGDDEVQQAIRFNIFQIHQNYKGDNPSLNIGSKGFTGEKYGGNTQWNTELCCIPYYLLAGSRNLAINLLLYRYNHLPKAIENAEKLGFTNGAALYPMVTMDGTECHNEWEITFEEIHRNGIIAHVIDLYTNFTGQTDYVAKYGLEVLIGISRFWSQRVSFSSSKQKYVILGVTGPNEYENNVDNNWYTNYSCIQNLKSTLHYLELVEKNYTNDFQRVLKKTNFQLAETKRWKDIIENMYLPVDNEKGIFVQQDGYMDKELNVVADINPSERPISQHWSWDRILRSCFIKQSDVLLGIYLYRNDFDIETVKKNFQFYEPRTLHESSLSYFIHSILAARIGEIDKAYDLFLKATRLDLDDYNNDLKEGLHITSMPGSWLALVDGFAGMKLKNGKASFEPLIPRKWKSYAFKVNFNGYFLLIKISQGEMNVSNLASQDACIQVYNKNYSIKAKTDIIIPINPSEK
ncbi:family 65 glycosyl hydrolase domain-containing protein [uncultured Bacteroides sp.]|uniref:family 65 glycosyl hydrolase domain-containing protein n=1 Tax=uncultured Bacteroides sp. TaxID=162156 RepID=UPI002AA6A409|nr:family 65 glycosyl hydrolase domain-containing protein [uncultured Bacteroides sp.]